ARFFTWRDATRASLKQKRAALKTKNSFGIYERVAEWYRTQSEQKSAKIAQSRWFSSAARLLAIPPQRLAVGMAEGVILGFLMAPIYYPLEFYLIVRYFQRRHSDTSM
ncbi:unnamed protein product, partial [Polarella glacialis]